MKVLLVVCALMFVLAGCVSSPPVPEQRLHEFCNDLGGLHDLNQDIFEDTFECHFSYYDVIKQDINREHNRHPSHVFGHGSESVCESCDEGSSQ